MTPPNPEASLARPYFEARKAIATLPALPSHLRYLDEYDDEWKAVSRPADSNCWTIKFDTGAVTFNFTRVQDHDVRKLLKHFAAWLLQTRSPRTATVMYSSIFLIIKRFGEEFFLEAIERSLLEWREYWERCWIDIDNVREVHLAKVLLHFLCEMCLGDFRPSQTDFIRSLPYKWPENYRGVLSGESILSANEEAAIIAYLDQLSEEVMDGSSRAILAEELTKACLLCISYQHGLRPIQILRINLDEFRIYQSDEGPLVHFLAYRAKKHRASEKTAFTCKIKREWACLFVEYHRRRLAGDIWKESDLANATKLFPITRATLIAAIGDVAEQVTGIRRTATEFRHSAAQRMADAGATIEEVGEFLGHTYAQSTLGYFEASPTQAEKLNKALAVSPIYSAIAEIAKSKTIDKEALLGLAPDNQIGAVPHGIPIAGIGACNVGQSLCGKNPVLSCYTCSKFLPLDEVATHRDVLDKLRPVVRFFFDEALGDNQSPAFVQLRIVLERIQAIIHALSPGFEEIGR